VLSLGQVPTFVIVGYILPTLDKKKANWKWQLTPELTENYGLTSNICNTNEYAFLINP